MTGDLVRQDSADSIPGVSSKSESSTSASSRAYDDEKTLALSNWFVTELGFVESYSQSLSMKLMAKNIGSVDRLKKKLMSKPDLLRSLEVDSDDERDILESLNVSDSFVGV